MTIREAIANVKEGINAVNADSRITPKYIYSKLVSKASLIFQRESDALRLIYLFDLYQMIPCMRVEEIPAIDPRCKVKSKAVFYRTVNKLPDTYMDDSGPIIKSIFTIDSSKSITLVTHDSIIRSKEDTNSKYDKNVYAFFENGYIYLTKKIPIKPEAAFVGDVSKFCDCDCPPDEDCTSFLDTNWRCPKRLQDIILSLVVQDLLGGRERIPPKLVEDKNPLT